MSGVKVSKTLRIGAAGEQPVTARPDPVTGGSVFSAGGINPFRGDITDPAFGSLFSTMSGNSGKSRTITVIGDSTGYDDFAWVRKLAARFATAFPLYRVEYHRFVNALSDYDVPVVVQAGPSGERHIAMPGTVRGRFLYPSVVGDLTGDIDVQVKCALDDWVNTGSQVFVSRHALSAGLYGFQFYVSFGTLRLNFKTNGEAASGAATSTAAVPFADGAAGWVRFTYEVANGNVKFYTSTDGVTWTQLGTTVSSGVTGAINNPATKAYELGSMNGNGGGGAGTGNLAAGKFYVARIRDGIGGKIINPQPIESWQSSSDDLTTLGGSPTLYVMNGSISGANLAYLSDTTRLPKLAHNVANGLTILNCSHNEIAAIEYGYKTSLDTWLTAMRTRQPTCSFAALTQNPKISPAAFIEPHAARMAYLPVWCRNNSVSVIDTWRGMETSGYAMVDLINADGIHPVSLGGDVQADYVFGCFAASARNF